MIDHAHLGQLGNHRVSQVVEPQTVEARGVPECAPSCAHLNIGLVAS